MLPMFKTKAIAAVTAFSLVTSAALPSHAWGAREQGVLTGVLGTLLVGALIIEANKPQTYKAPKAQPVYAPVPTSIYSTPVAAQFNAYSDSSQRRIQSTLSAYGYYSAAIDGAFGPSTYNATVAYAKATGKSTLLTTQAGVKTLYEQLLY